MSNFAWFLFMSLANSGPLPYFNRVSCINDLIAFHSSIRIRAYSQIFYFCEILWNWKLIEHRHPLFIPVAIPVLCELAGAKGVSARTSGVQGGWLGRLSIRRAPTARHFPYSASTPATTAAAMRVYICYTCILYSWLDTMTFLILQYFIWCACFS